MKMRRITAVSQVHNEERQQQHYITTRNMQCSPVNLTGAGDANVPRIPPRDPLLVQSPLS